MFVGYGSGWQDGARNRLAAHPKGEFMPGAILRGWLGGREPLHKVPDHVPFSDLTIPDHVPFPRHIVLLESEDGHSMLGFYNFAAKYMKYSDSIADLDTAIF